jgi:hypothetical protein
MRSLAGPRLAIALFAGLLALSIGLKAAFGPELSDPATARPGALEDRLARQLQSQGFVVRRQDTRWQGQVIWAMKGGCRLTVRDATRAESQKVVFAHDAASVGQLRYLFAGRAFASPPTSAIVAARIESKLLHRLRLSGTLPVAVALATSPGCGSNDFGLADMRVPV